jgi:hypothetical protein
MNHKKISFGEWMITFVPKAFIIGIITVFIFCLVESGIKFIWYTVTCSSPIGC